MRNKLVALMLVASQFALWGCYFEGPEYTEELDIVYTNYDNKFNFDSKGTYSMPDSITKVTGEPGKPPEFVKNVYAQPILAEIRAQMTALGWTEVTVNQTPDIQLLPAAWTSTTIIYGGYWGGYYCWYYPYYCGGGWYYPYTPVSSYTTGTMLMTIIDPNAESTDGSKRVLWTAAINGLLSGTYNLDRIKKGVDQAFAQSPYLNTKD